MATHRVLADKAQQTKYRETITYYRFAAIRVMEILSLLFRAREQVVGQEKVAELCTIWQHVVELLIIQTFATHPVSNRVDDSIPW